MFLMIIALIILSIALFLKFKMGFFDTQASEDWDILNTYLDLSDEALERKSAEMERKTQEALNQLRLNHTQNQKFPFDLKLIDENQILFSPLSNDLNQKPLSQKPLSQKSSVDFNFSQSSSAIDFSLRPQPKPNNSTEIAENLEENRENLAENLEEAQHQRKQATSTLSHTNMVMILEIIQHARKQTKSDALFEHTKTLVAQDQGLKNLVKAIKKQGGTLTAKQENSIKTLSGKLGEHLTEMIFKPYFHTFKSQVSQKLKEGSSIIDLIAVKAKKLIILNHPDFHINPNQDCYIEVKCGQNQYFTNILAHLTSRQILAHLKNHKGKFPTISLVITTQDLRGSKIEKIFRSKVRDAGSKSWALLPAKAELDRILRTVVIAKANGSIQEIDN
jgi:hypothetical protein